MSEESTSAADADGISELTPVDWTTPNTTTTMTRHGLAVVERSHVWTADVVQRVGTLAPLMAATLLGNVVALLGNVVTMVVLACSRYRSVNSRINIFIVNLAAGDLAVCCFTMSTEVFRPNS